MVIGACSLELHLPGNGSLKGKRQVIKSLLARLRKEFNVSVAEVGAQPLSASCAYRTTGTMLMDCSPGWHSGWTKAV
jgi:hypothetical protein